MKATISTRKALAIVLTAIALTAIVTYVFAASSTIPFTISGGNYPGAPSYTVWCEGSNYFAKNASGVVEFSGTNATQVIQNVAESLVGGSAVANKGGKIFICNGIYELSIGITIQLQEAGSTPRPLHIVGEGEGTVFRFTGTGYALTINTTYTTYEWVCLENFKIDCVSKTTGRNGLRVFNVGRRVVIRHVKIYRADVAVALGDSDNTGANCISLYDVRVVTANIGFYVAPAAVNEIIMYSCDAVNTYTHGYYLEGGTSIRLYGCSAAPYNGYGITVNSTWGTLLSGCRVEGVSAGNYEADIYAYSTDTLTIDTPYLSGVNAGKYAIKLYSTDKTTVQNLRSRLHTIAVVFIENAEEELLFINPLFDETYMFNSTSLSMVTSRTPGMVITERAVALIMASPDTLAYGDVVTMAASGAGYCYKTTGADNKTLGVVLYGNLANSPAVVAISGIAQVNMSVAVSQGDKIVSAANGQGAVDNTETDPQQILGYAFEGTASPQLTWVKIGS